MRSGRSWPYRRTTSILLISPDETYIVTLSGLKTPGMMSENTFIRYLNSIIGQGNAAETWGNGALQESNRDGSGQHFGKVPAATQLCDFQQQ